MAWLVWAGVITVVLLLEWLAWRIADRLDRAEQCVAEWEAYVQWLDQTNPQYAAYLRWQRENQ